MADFILFNDGANAILDGGITGTVYLALSTRDCDTHKAADKLAGGVGEVAGATGYARKSQVAPGAGTQKKAFAQATWETAAAVDWPASVKSVVLIVGAVAVMAWNLKAGGGARDLSAANTTEKFTPTYTLA